MKKCESSTLVGPRMKSRMTFWSTLLVALRTLTLSGHCGRLARCLLIRTEHLFQHFHRSPCTSQVAHTRRLRTQRPRSPPLLLGTLLSVRASAWQRYELVIIILCTRSDWKSSGCDFRYRWRLEVEYIAAILEEDEKGAIGIHGCLTGKKRCSRETLWGPRAAKWPLKLLLVKSARHE